MLNKNTYGTEKARPIRSSSYLTIAVTKSFDISQGQELANYRWSAKVASHIT